MLKYCHDTILAHLNFFVTRYPVPEEGGYSFVRNSILIWKLFKHLNNGRTHKLTNTGVFTACLIASICGCIFNIFKLLTKTSTSDSRNDMHYQLYYFKALPMYSLQGFLFLGFNCIEFLIATPKMSEDKQKSYRCKHLNITCCVLHVIGKTLPPDIKWCDKQTLHNSIWKIIFCNWEFFICTPRCSLPYPILWSIPSMGGYPILPIPNPIYITTCKYFLCCHLHLVTMI